MTQAVAELVYLRNAKGGYEPQKRPFPYITASDKRTVVARYPLTKDEVKITLNDLMLVYPPPVVIETKESKGVDVRGGAETRQANALANPALTVGTPPIQQAPLTPAPRLPLV